MAQQQTTRPSWWQTVRVWPRPAKWLLGISLALVLVLLATAVVAWVVVRRPLPQTSGEIQLPGLTSSVEVVRDGNGIPQIYADTTADLMRAQGYVHAQDRFYEMDIRRHITAGRLSELFGAETLDTDKAIRTMGWRRVAEQELALISPDTRAALEAYADGVNAYLDTHSLGQISVEYTLLRATGLDYTPEPWTPVDSLAWLKAMAWDLRGNMDDEVARVLLSVNHDQDRIDELYPAYPYATHAPIVGEGAVVDGVFEQGADPGGTRNPKRPAFTPGEVAAVRDVHRALRSVPALLGSGRAGADGLGSNSWVVDGEHSATGKPLLANDPHLGVSMPGIWSQVGLHCRTVDADCPFEVSGFSFSGVPGVVIGHNASIAWGFTNLGPDVTDLYLEKVRGERWLYDGAYRPLTIREEVIKVRDEDDFNLTVRSTRHGPLLSDVSQELSTVGANADAPPGPDPGNGFAVALEWTALHPAPTADAILGLATASNWSEFRAAASDFAVPAQNLVYADTEGHIGYQAPGRIPVRKSGNDGLVPSAGWLPENDWTGTSVPFEALPNVLDPDEGFIATANQAVIGPDYRYFLTSDWDYGYRSQRIRDRLLDEGELSIAEMSALQLDTYNAMAPTLVPYLLDIELPGGYDSDGQRLLDDWDFAQPADSAAAAYYNVVWKNLLQLTFHDELRESLWPDGGGRWWLAVTGLLQEPANPWWDDRTTDDVVETRDDILTTALIDARDELTRREALDPKQWTWGRLHRLDLHNATLGESGIGLVERLLNRDGYQVGGGGSAVDATAWDAGQGYDVISAPSMRMVVSLADFDASRWINLTGVSGHPTSGHYTDQTDLYVAGETLPWVFGRSAVEDAAEDTLTFTP
ncbi:penicillin acylase family protein [Nocardioides sp.]|uniref:penicillin acylase family protein n=1 Tax=Nocardioides sp. TaxID=35761 RepID=UPI003D0B11C6